MADLKLNKTKTMKLFVRKTVSGLIPENRTEFDNLQNAKLKLNEVYEVEIKKKRNYEFHKKYFALINICFENQEHFELIDDLRDYITVKSGFYRKVLMPNGYEQIKPKSVSFAKMDEIEFNELYDSTLNVIVRFLDCSNEDIIEALKDF